MDPRKNISSQLFTVNHPYGAICATVNTDKHWTRVSCMVTHTNVVSDKHHYLAETTMNATSYSYATDDGLTILPNGFYFYHPRKNFEGYDKKDPSGKGGVLLMNALVPDQYMAKPFPVDAFIDTRFAADLSLDEHEKVVVGINRDHTKLFTYSMLLPSEHNRAFRLAVSAKHETGIVGTCIYEANKAKNIKIASFCASLSGFRPALVIGYDTGEIRAGYISDDTLDIMITLQENTADFKRMQLLSTTNGLVLAHSPEHNCLRIWDMTKRELQNEFIEHRTLPDMHDLSISSDGKYLIGLNGNDACSTDVVHCFELATFTHHPLKLQAPVEAFAICQQGMVLVAMDSSPHDLGRTKILKIGTIEAILKKCHETIPLDESQNQLELDKEPRKHAFGKLKSLFHHDNKPNHGDSDKHIFRK